MLVSIGIDQSFSSTAVVIVDVERDVLVSYTVFTTKKERDDRLDKIIRARHIADEMVGFIYEVCTNNKAVIQNIIIEGVGFAARGDATRDLAGLQFILIDALMSSFNLEPIVVAPTSLKKFACGKGNGSKQDVIDATPECYRTQFLTKYKKSSLDDFCDAYWLSKMNASIMPENKE